MNATANPVKMELLVWIFRIIGNANVLKDGLVYVALLKLMSAVVLLVNIVVDVLTNSITLYVNVSLVILEGYVNMTLMNAKANPVSMEANVQTI